MNNLLPNALINSIDFRQLSKAEAKQFQSRINFITEIAINIQEWVHGKNNIKMLDDFLDNLELDVAINLDIASNPESISNWLIHSTWDFDNAISLDTLPSVIRKSLDDDLPRLNIVESEINLWLKEQSNVLIFTLNAFSLAKDYSTALSLLLALDIIMAKLLASQYKFRLILSSDN